MAFLTISYFSQLNLHRLKRLLLPNLLPLQRSKSPALRAQVTIRIPACDFPPQLDAIRKTNIFLHIHVIPDSSSDEEEAKKPAVKVTPVKPAPAKAAPAKEEDSEDSSSSDEEEEVKKPAVKVTPAKPVPVKVTPAKTTPAKKDDSSSSGKRPYFEQLSSSILSTKSHPASLGQNQG